MKMKTTVLLVIVCTTLFTALMWFQAKKIERFSQLEAGFSDVLTTLTNGDEIYHVLPESKLGEPIMIVDKEGKRYYVISGEQLQLLGPKLLTGDSND